MNTKSIRFRVLAWYTITLFFATAFIFSGFYFVTKQILFNKVDQELTTHAEKLAEIVTRQGVNMHEEMLKQQLYNEFSEIPGMVVILMDENGTVVSSSLASGNPYDSYNFLYKQAKEEKIPAFLNLNIKNSPMRITAYPINQNNSIIGVVLVAHPIDAIEKSLNSLLTTLGFIFALLIIPTIIGGRLLAGKIMLPISAISNQMEKIGSEKLEERVDNPQTNDEIEKLVTTFNGLLDRLQDAFERERQFIGDVAHELKTPVATLRSEIELTLSKSRTTNEYKKALEESLIDANSLSTKIANILDLAWIKAENAKLGEEHFSLSNCLNEIREIGIKIALQKQITLESKIEQNIEISGDQDKISRAILNIVDNAIKYTPNKGTVRIDLHKKGDNVIVRVIDNGIGIPKKELPRIFDRFYRGSRANKIFGSGLGLAIAQGIIKAYKGSIDVISSTSKGTTVRVILPLNHISS